MNINTAFTRASLLIVALAFSSVSIVNAQVQADTAERGPKPPCNCKAWSGLDAIIVSHPPLPPMREHVKCGGHITLKKGTYTITSPQYICTPQNCIATYLWHIGGPLFHTTTAGQTFTFNFSLAGTYNVTFTPICGGRRCPPCIFKLVVM